MPHAASTPSPPSTPPGALVVGADDQRPAADLLQGRLMQRSLARLLDRVPNARQALPYLAALEASLGRNGGSALSKVPPPILKKIHAQLSQLPADDSDSTLRELVNCVRKAVVGEERQRTHQLSPFDPESTVVILEGSHTDFMRAMDGDVPPR